MSGANMRNPALDALRALACILVVTIHIKFPGEFGNVVASLARMAVPLFLMISGWFSWWEDSGVAVNNARRKGKEMIRLLMVNVAICILWNSVNSLLQGKMVLAWIQPHLNRTGLMRFLLYNRAHFFNSITYYLLMMIYVYGIYIVLLKTKLVRVACWFVPALLAAAVLLQIRQHPWYHSGNFLLTGLPYFLLGNYLGSKLKSKAVSAGWKWSLFLFGGGLTCLEMVVFQLNQYVYFGTAFLTTACLLTAIQWKGPVCPPVAYMAAWERKYATYVFLIHCNVINTLNIYLKDNMTYQWIAPFAVIGISVLIAMGHLWLKAQWKRKKTRNLETNHGI